MITDLYAFSKSKINTPAMYQVILQYKIWILILSKYSWEGGRVREQFLIIGEHEIMFCTWIICQTQRQASLENTGAIISTNLWISNKKVISKTINLGWSYVKAKEWVGTNITDVNWIHTLHMAASVDQCTSQVFPPFLWMTNSNNKKIKKSEEYQYKCIWRSNNKCRSSHLWTSLPSLFLVICHVKPLFGSKPGWEISNPCFLTSLIYLHLIDNINHPDSFKQHLHSQRNWIFHSLLWIKILHSKVFIPDKYIVIGCHDARMQKTFGIPPCINFREFDRIK